MVESDLVEAVRREANQVLEQTLPVLLEEHVVPRPRHSPWIRIARDYYGESIRGGSGLPDAIQAAYPDRFTTSPSIFAEHPWGYDMALIEAAVAAATRAGEPYDVTSPSVQAVVDEFICSLAQVAQVHVANVVADVGTADGRELQIGDTRLVPVPGGAERFLERLIPGSGFMLEREDAVGLGADRTSVLVASASGAGSMYAREPDARANVRHVLGAIRLATGTTATALADVSGPPSRVRSGWPTVRSLPRRALAGTARRTAIIGPDDVPGLARLAAALGGPVSDPVPTVWVAFGRLSRSLDEPARNLSDHVVDLATGLEAALAGGPQETDIALRLRSRAGALLATQGDSEAVIYDDVKILYGLRSTFVHGSTMTEERLWRLIGRVSTAVQSQWRGEQMDLAIDRWRDILRRAVLLRLALGDGDEAVWPLRGDTVDVDRRLLDAALVAEWRSAARAYWGERGLANTMDRPLPLEGIIARPHSSTERGS